MSSTRRSYGLTGFQKLRRDYTQQAAQKREVSRRQREVRAQIAERERVREQAERKTS